MQKASTIATGGHGARRNVGIARGMSVIEEPPPPNKHTPNPPADGFLGSLAMERAIAFLNV